MLQPGNSVEAVWRARLDEHLGIFTIEGQTMRSSRLIASPLALYGIAAMASLLRLVPERDPHPGLYAAAVALADHLDDAGTAPALFVRFELALLAELGFGLDLSECAATGERDDLAFVSPKSGRAVSAGAGAPYMRRLFALPAFLHRRDRRRAEPGRDQGRLRLDRVLPAHPSLRGARAAGPGGALALRRAVHKKRSFTGRLARVLDSFRQLRRG